MSATLNCVAWKLEMGPPNCCRAFVYSRAVSRQNCAPPTLQRASQHASTVKGVLSPVGARAMFSLLPLPPDCWQPFSVHIHAQHKPSCSGCMAALPTCRRRY